MIQSYSLYTSQADSPNAAVSEIQEQLSGIQLSKHSVGLITCHADYFENGIVQSLQEVTGFPLVGITTFYQATPEVSGLFELTITVLTSEDVRFTLACSASDEDSITPADRIYNTYQQALDVSGERPALVLSFLTVDRPITGDAFLRHLDAASDGVPCFGAVNSGEDESGANIYVFCDGQSFSNGYAILLMTGDIHTAFYSTTADPDSLLNHSATVTKADGVFLQELNGQPAMSYLSKNSIELGEADKANISTIPFYYHKAGEPAMIGRAMKTFYDDGTMEFLAEVPEGTLLRAGTMTADDVLRDSFELVQRAVTDNPDASLFLMFSCVGRFIMLGLDTTSEMDHVVGLVPKSANHLACYVMGEVCPVRLQEGPKNHYLNNSFIICALH